MWRHIQHCRLFSGASAATAGKPRRFDIGDLVEISNHRNGRTFQGVIASVSGASIRSVLVNGHLHQHTSKDITFHSSNWARNEPAPNHSHSKVMFSVSLSPDAQKLIELNHLPPSLPTNIIAFRKAVDRIMTEHIAKFEQVYHHFSRHQRTAVSLDEVTALVFHVYPTAALYTPTTLEKYAAHQYLSRAVAYFAPIPQSSEFKLVQTSDRAILSRLGQLTSTKMLPNQIVDMKEEHPDLTAFLEKAARLIEFSNCRNEANLQHLRPSDIEFTDTDRIFIHSLFMYATSSPDNGRVVYARAVDRGILQTLGPKYYPASRRNQSMARMVLRDIGVWTPWEGGDVYNSLSHALQGLEGTGNSAWADSCWELMQQDTAKLLQSPPAAVHSINVDTAMELRKKVMEQLRGVIVMPESVSEQPFLTTDVCSSIRRDFTGTPVFVIDDPLAHELDDGISFERCDDDTSWIHVHIADPTAYISPNSALALIAQARGASVYLPEKTYTMFPHSVSERGWDLRGRGDGKATPAMTFSAKLNQNGEIVDFDVKPSLIRNVKIMSYDDVDKVLDWTYIYQINLEPQNRHPSIARYLEKGLALRNQAMHKAIDEKEREDLLALQTRARSHSQMRLKNGLLQSAFGDTDLRLFWPDNINNNALVSTSQTVTAQKPAYPPAFPSIRLRSYSPDLSPSHILVSESMVIAGRVAAMYSKSRKLPVPYRGQISMFDHIREHYHPSAQDSAVATVQTALASRDPTSGLISPIEYEAATSYMPPASISTSPLSQFSMGIPDGYVKVTSPLRRYLDLLAHIQINHTPRRSKRQHDTVRITINVVRPYYRWQAYIPSTNDGQYGVCTNIDHDNINLVHIAHIETKHHSVSFKGNL
ncbi:hypothetical protein SeMB42_g03985 [Synchytrium endobioticum]|uniref:RNB domain-containing protein n=1 Tax=Synchytrium endobioticum TaxID=286115 RepID=A0A507D2B9_9FUNG|nr:hypothetical protein SeMB42_g03985 [Synchytrium endobioticum]